MAKKKFDTKVEEITQGLPREMHEFYLYCREGIEFDERPDYGMLKGLLYSVIYKEQFKNVLCFSWQL